MQLNLDFNVLLYVILILILLAIVMAMKTRAGIVFKIIFRCILGGAFIFLFNLVGQMVNFTIPFNIATILLTGLLQIPGFALILIIKYIIYP